MRRTRSLGCAALAAAALLGAAGALAAEGAGAGTDAQVPDASWSDIMYELLYRIMHLSTINVVNGIGLSRAQAVELRGIAAELERKGVRPPETRRRWPAELREARAAYVELEEVLLAGGDVSPALQARVMRARETTSLLVRGSLVKAGDSAGNSFEACHPATALGDPETRSPPAPVTAQKKRTALVAHQMALFGLAGSIALLGAADRVDAILSDEQKLILGDFSCCLVPPTSLSNPVRAGQVGENDKIVELLGKVRECGEGAWAFVEPVLARRLVEMMKARRPGFTQQEEDALRAQMKSVFAKVRGMSDAEFALQKRDIAREVDPSAPAPDAKGAKTKAAAFLLTPGAVGVYDAYLRRLDAGEGARGE